MGFSLIYKGKKTERHLRGPRTLAEILNDKEYQQVEDGTLVALSDGALLSLSARLEDGETIELRRPDFERDFQAFGVPVNAAGEIASVRDLARIRDYETQHRVDLYERPLAEILSLLEDNAQQRSFFASNIPVQKIKELGDELKRKLGRAASSAGMPLVSLGAGA